MAKLLSNIFIELAEGVWRVFFLVSAGWRRRCRFNVSGIITDWLGGGVGEGMGG